MNSVKRCHFLVIGNDRLNFQNSSLIVKDFVRKRLEHAGAESIMFVADRASLHQEGERFLKAVSKDKGQYMVILDIMNPITDLELVHDMVASLERSNKPICVSDGAVPGTQIDFVLAADRIQVIPPQKDFDLSNTIRKRSLSQDRHNNQFNLYKYKRLKMFLHLCTQLPTMHEMTIDEFVGALEQDEIFNQLAAYGEAVRLVRHSLCPHCEGALQPMPLKMAQPFCGYLPSSRALYHECERCSLTILSPAVHEDDIDRIYDIFDKQDFSVSPNNPYQSGSARCDFSAIIDKLPENTRALDMGGGIGRFSQYLKGQFPKWSVTHSDFEIKENAHLREMGISTRTLNLLQDPIGSSSYDLITAWEVIEHVPYNRLSHVLDKVHEALAPGGMFVFSTPDMDSPLCNAFDFYGICPPFHYLVFGERWLRQYFSSSNKWDYLKPRMCSDFLDSAEMWFDYGTKACPSFQVRATSSFLGEIFKLDVDCRMRETLVKKGLGTEVIITLRKK